MASPFDFSSFLLTPPIPSYSSGGGGAATAAPSQPQQQGGSGGGGAASSSNSSNAAQGTGEAASNAANDVMQGSSSAAGPSGLGQGQRQQQQQQQTFQSPRQPHQQQQQQYQQDRGNLPPAQSTSGTSSSSSSMQTQQQQQQQQFAAPADRPTTSGQAHVGSQQQQQQQLQSTTGTSSRLASFDDRDYGLDPSAFSSVSFQMPSFLAASSQPGQFGDGPLAVDPSAFLAPSLTNSNPIPFSFHNNPPASNPSLNGGGPGAGGGGNSNAPTFPLHFPSNGKGGARQQQQQQQQQYQQQQQPHQSKNVYQPDPHNPVYGIYGSSVISVNPDASPFKLQLNSAQPTSNPTNYPESRGGTPDFDPKALGLPVGNQLFPQPLPGLYSSSGFDMLGVLARVVARPNPQINIGPVDTSCSFLVVDARRYDMPIVFASSTFSELTGYQNSEIIGRNCRFLQAPDGHVAMGSRRKYTDGNAVYHLKTHIQSGKESQASIINYRKDGSPFINLVTVVPITWDTDEIAYFVGFQVDLVEQPNAILEKMKNGTYVVNYSLLPTNQPAPQTMALPDKDSRSQVYDAAARNDADDNGFSFDGSAWSEQKPVKVIDPIASNAAAAAAAQSSMTIAPELLEVMGAVDTGNTVTTNNDEADDDAAKKKWNKMLLDHTGDFVHVLSLKGSFLYVSPSVRPMLEYEPSDLIGKTLQSVCHPSDIVPVMRELKESSTVTHPILNLLYRFRRKHSGYIWLEAQGKLYLEQSKSRKCVILVGRERPVYKLSWDELRFAGGLGEKEFWSKVTGDGMYLYNTPSVRAVIGHEADDLRGRSMYEMVEQDKTTNLAKALQEATSGRSVRFRHKLRNTKGTFVDVVTNFFPNANGTSTDRPHVAGIVHPSIITQTNEYASEQRRRATAAQPTSSLPTAGGTTPGGPALPGRPGMYRATSSQVNDMIVNTPDRDGSDSPGAGSGGGGGSGSDSSAPSTFSAIPSTYKSLLNQQAQQSDNVFEELDTTKTTSWQYELHQLKLTNRKLKEELAMLQAARRKRKKKEDAAASTTGPGGAAARGDVKPGTGTQGIGQGATAAPVKSCANCGRTDSPEWRVGPSGQRSLCNACGLRWAKATRGTGVRNNSNSSGASGGIGRGSATPSSASDMEQTSSFAQQLTGGGPFAPAGFGGAR